MILLIECNRLFQRSPVLEITPASQSPRQDFRAADKFIAHQNAPHPSRTSCCNSSWLAVAPRRYTSSSCSAVSVSPALANALRKRHRLTSPGFLISFTTESSLLALQLSNNLRIKSKILSHGMSSRIPIVCLHLLCRGKSQSKSNRSERFTDQPHVCLEIGVMGGQDGGYLAVPCGPLRPICYRN